MIKKKGTSTKKGEVIRSLSLTLFVITLILSISGVLWPQEKIGAGEEYLVENWNVEHGLESDVIRSVAQSTDGFLWIATEKSLSRYDGVTFVTIPYVPAENGSGLKTVMPDGLLMDNNGVLWIGSAAGLTMYRLKDRQFVTHSFKGGLAEDRLRTMSQDRSGKIWVSSYSTYVSRFADGEFNFYNDDDGLMDKRVNVILGWKNDHVMFGTRENGVFIFDGKEFKPLSIPPLKDRQIIKMHIDRFGDLWIGTNDGLFRFIHSNIRKWVRYSIEDGLSDNFISAFAEDDSGNLWVGTESKGITLIQHQAGGSLRFESMLQSLSVTCLFFDRGDNLWIGTQGAGLLRLKNKKLSSFRPLESHPQEDISSIFQSASGVTWLGTENGKLFRLDSGKVISVELPSILEGANLAAISEDTKSNLWLATSGRGAFRCENGEWYRLLSNQGLADNLVTTIFRDRSGDLWFGTFDGVSVRRSSDNSMEVLRIADGLLGKVVHAIYEDKNQHILVATDKGLTFIKDGLILKKNIKHLLKGVSVTCMKQDNLFRPEEEETVYWIATHGGGLKRLTLNGGTAKNDTFDHQSGIPTNLISSFFEDEFGYFWMLSDLGILRVSKISLNKYSKNNTEPVHCWIYGESDGVDTYNFIEFAQNLAIETKDGEFWFANKREILKINPSEVKITGIAPTVILESVLRDEKDVSVRYQEPENVFKGKGDWAFRFTSPFLASPEKVRFKYRLNGLSDGWEYLSYKADRMAEYKDLGAGEYRFEVFACNADGIWSAEPATYSFVVEAFFIETATFRGLLVVSFMGLIGLSIYLYLLWKNKPEAKRLPAYHGTQPLHPDFARECLKKLDHQMKVEKIYTDPELTLKKLADSINVNTHTLSRLLNDNLDVRFSEFVNTNRIDEAKRILTDPQRAHVKIISVGLEVGFNTMPAFYNAFKKNTGMTPSTYKKKMQKKKK
jgi:ligand-binding sensor domain-containing protein/AraC-like DNA-binding protein